MTFLDFLFISEKSRPEVRSRWRRSSKIWCFRKKTPDGQIFVNVFWKDSPSRRSASCVQNSWNLADRKSVKSRVAYLTKKNKKSPRSLASALTELKISQGQRQTMYSEYPNFHPNPFTSGGVIGERVNTVQTRHKVFPILGEAIASWPSNG